LTVKFLVNNAWPLLHFSSTHVVNNFININTH